jgi:hypothetical protein
MSSGKTLLITSMSFFLSSWLSCFFTRFRSDGPLPFLAYFLTSLDIISFDLSSSSGSGALSKMVSQSKIGLSRVFLLLFLAGCSGLRSV